MACVLSSTRTQRQPVRCKSGWWPSSSATALTALRKSMAAFQCFATKLRLMALWSSDSLHCGSAGKPGQHRAQGQRGRALPAAAAAFAGSQLLRRGGRAGQLLDAACRQRLQARHGGPRRRLGARRSVGFGQQ
ncbi:unnamed protein product [Prorocentrum cordatum]|nr:unnamed protein product [Polarella glacialis]